jgi:glycosyltransferase involved in cell wall biosynthesis
MLRLLTIVIPAYNEESALPAHLPEVISFCEERGYRLIVVDDGSTDSTASILKGFEQHDCLTVITNKVQQGYGGAIKRGIAAAETDYIATIDADGQHLVDDVETLFKETLATDADMIVGRRTNIEAKDWYRNLGKALIRGIAKLLMPLHIHDINSGMKIYNTALAQHYSELCPDSMAFSDVITLTFINQKHRVLERAIRIRPRTLGVSTIGNMTALDTVRQILNIVVLFNPMRIFFPSALVLIVFGILWEIPIAMRGRGLSVAAMLAMVSGVIFFFLGLIAEQLSLLRKRGITKR